MRNCNLSKNAGSGLRIEAKAEAYVETCQLESNKTFGVYVVDASAVLGMHAFILDCDGL